MRAKALDGGFCCVGAALDLERDSTAENVVRYMFRQVPSVLKGFAYPLISSISRNDSMDAAVMPSFCSQNWAPLVSKCERLFK